MNRHVTAGHNGFVHQAAFYGSDDELLRVVLPYIRAAVEAREPVFAALPDPEADLLRAALPADGDGLTFIRHFGAELRPPSAIQHLRALADAVDGGTKQVHVIATVPHPGLGSPWDGWCRYEAAVNDVLAGIPLWSLCMYDRRITSDVVRADVALTHPFLLGEDGRHEPNTSYQEPEAFLDGLLAPPLDPLELLPPALEIADPQPAAGRRAVREIAPLAHLSGEETDDLAVAVSEAITNAITHGGRPVRFRAWVAADRVVVAVTDGGRGPHHPHAGLVPTGSANGMGLGLWLIHQMTTATTHSWDADGFTVHMVAGDAPPLQHRP